MTFGTYSGISLKVESTGSINCSGQITITGVDSSASTSDTDGTTLINYYACILRSGLSSLQGFGSLVPPNQTFGGATFTSSGSGTAISLSNNITCTGTATNPGYIILAGNVSLGSTTIQISTTGASTGGISITGNIDGASANTASLNLQANSSAAASVSGAIGATNKLVGLSITAGSISIGNIGTAGASGVTNSITLTSSGNFTFSGTNYNTTGPATYITAVAGSFFFTNTGTVSFISSNQSIAFTNGTFHSSTNPSITFNPGSAALTVPPIGSAVTDFNVITFQTTSTLTTTGAILAGSIAFASTPTAPIGIGGNITTNNTTVTFPVAVQLTASPIVLTTGTLQFSGTLNGNGTVTNPNLQIIAGSNTVTFSNTVGATNTLGNLNVAAGTIAQTNTVHLGGTGILTYNATTINISGSSGNITTSGGAISITGAVTQTPTALTLSSSGGTITLAGASWIGSASSDTLTLTAGAGNIISIVQSAHPVGRLDY